MRFLPVVLPLSLLLSPLAAIANPPESPRPPEPDAAERATYRACMSRMRGTAAAKGVPAATFDRLTAGLAPDMGVLPLLDRQPEFTTPIWDYLAALVDGQRVADGRAMLEAHAGTLARVE